ncbi:anthocyanin regulatory R-S protein-like [Phalaenopsis equestris]|uniref:anthocyanin regulatory R-S protein-like n=1 Tax=Phalaenopsis equestris TaxID=78828 RepID=UPI0009E252B6|nr:anthocyanin regulatory R-S protein-like [Phalaenopsis equestris]
MVMEMQSQELQQNHFLRQLAACVKRIQWIYAIFWSESSRVGRCDLSMHEKVGSSAEASNFNFYDILFDLMNCLWILTSYHCQILRLSVWGRFFAASRPRIAKKNCLALSVAAAKAVSRSSSSESRDSPTVLLPRSSSPTRFFFSAFFFPALLPRPRSARSSSPLFSPYFRSSSSTRNRFLHLASTGVATSVLFPRPGPTRSLEWNDGYYNGDIKTRKTTQQTECRVDEMGLQRTEQLRELYESLCNGDCNQQTRPSASLSPEDLTDKEWYYLVCMSFTFNFGQDLPGKAYELNESIWLNNAHFAENSCFCRSLLAKSASIQTVVCLPFMDGVLELGTTELVMEEPGFLLNITSSFWELQLPGFSEHSTSSSPLERKEEEDDVCLISNHEVQGTIMSENPALIIEDDSHLFPFSVDSYAPDINSDLIHYKEIIGINIPNEPSQVHIRHLMADEFNNGLNSSLNLSECVSPQNIPCSPKGERLKGYVFNHSREDNHSKLGSLGIEEDGSHYFSSLSAILGDLEQGRSSPGFPFQNRHIDSSFRVWEEGSKSSKIFIRFPQRMLKKILFGRNWINGDEWVKSHEENVPRNKAFKSEADDANSNHVLSERRRREKLNEKFVTLRSLVPSISKVDKASVLADTIEYLKDLEKRVEELEFCREERDTDMREPRKHPDITERTSDNYGNNEFIISQKSSSNKRKACEMDDSDAQLNLILSNNGLFDINVTMIDREVLIELHCPWRDFLLLDIIEALCNLRLDPHSVRSSTPDPTTVIALRAKIMSTTVTSPGMIKRSLQRVLGKGGINL